MRLADTIGTFWNWFRRLIRSSPKLMAHSPRLIALTLLLPFSSFTQNLLVNGSFEDENICTEYIKNCAPEGWISNTLISNYYFNIPYFGYEGIHFVGLITGNTRNPQKHSFVRSRLICGLRKDHLYVVRFYIRSRHPVYDSTGVYFSDTDFLFDKRPYPLIKPSLLYRDTISGTAGVMNTWKKMEWIYKAQGTESYVTIGNFKTKEASYRNPPEINGDYYLYLDSASITPLDEHELLCSSADSMKNEIYAENERHNLLEKKIAYYKRTPPAQASQPPVTEMQTVDTLIIPDILFASGSAKINTLNVAVLDSFARSLRRGPLDSLVIEGHTDSIGKLSYNTNLSLERARAVSQYISERVFLRPQQLIERHFAFSRPVASNQTESGRQKNRRVEIFVYRRLKTRE